VKIKIILLRCDTIRFFMQGYQHYGVYKAIILLYSCHISKKQEMLAPSSDLLKISQRHPVSYLSIIFSAVISLKSLPSQLLGKPAANSAQLSEP